MPLTDINVGEIHSKVVTTPASVKKGTSLEDAVATILRDPRTHTLYVVNKKERVVGMVGAMDLIHLATFRGHQQNKTSPGRTRAMKLYSLKPPKKIEDVMHEPIVVKQSDAALKALALMEQHGAYDLAVVDDDGKLIGELNGLEILAQVRDFIRSWEQSHAGL